MVVDSGGGDRWFVDRIALVIKRVGGIGFGWSLKLFGMAVGLGMRWVHQF